MRLFISEKPSMAREIAKGLGESTRKDGYIEIGNDIVTWEYGHLLENFMPEDYDEKYKSRSLDLLPIVPDIWQLKVRENARKQFKVIKSLAGKADIIVNAGDPDREGQLLVDELLEYLGNRKPVQRILLNALDEKSVHQALGDLRDNDDFVGLKNSARARSYADWLVGMNLSRAFSAPARSAGYVEPLRIGRVKTPTMSLVVRREEEIRNFKPVDYYQLEITWQHANGSICSLWQPKDTTEGLNLENRLIQRDIAESLLQKLSQSDMPAVIMKVEKKQKKEMQHAPFSLSTLQVEAGRKFGYDPKKVLSCMQSLYEKKLTTYPRSDCNFLPEHQWNEAREVLEHLKSADDGLAAIIQSADLTIKSQAWNDKKISAHHAIIPTCQKCDLSSLSEEERNLYLLVAKVYIAQFYPVHTYEATKLWLECAGESFTATGKVILTDGWKSLFAKDKTEKNDTDEDEKALPVVAEGDRVSYQEGRILDKVTKPPTRFTPATLLKGMKEIHKYVKDQTLKTKLKSVSGIGTEATRADIIDSLLNYGFLAMDKKYLVPTDKAYMMMKFLPDTLTYPDTTAIWEDELESVKNNEESVEEFINGKIPSIEHCIQEAKYLKIEPAQDVPRCPKCGKAVVKRMSKTKKVFWACSGYPDCHEMFPDKNGKPDLSYKPIECPECHNGTLRKIKGKYGMFWGCSNRECNKTFPDKRGKPDLEIHTCPACRTGTLRRIKGKYGYFWGCSNRDDCGKIFKDANGKPDFSEKKKEG